MPAFGNPNRSIQNPFKPGQPGHGMQPFNTMNAITGGIQPQAATATVPNTAPVLQFPEVSIQPVGDSPFPIDPTVRALQQQPGIERAIDEILGATPSPVMPYVPSSNADLFARLLGLQGDVAGLSLPLLNAILGQEARMQGLLESQDNSLLRQLLEQTQAIPSPRPRSGTSFFRGFSG